MTLPGWLKWFQDIYNRIGAPTGATISADIVAVKSDTGTTVSELAKVPKSDAAVSWNATALGAINAEVDTALNTIVPASPTAGSVNDVLSKAAGGNTFIKATDSLEMLSDKAGGFSGDGGAAQDDSVKASLDLAHTDLDAIITVTGALQNLTRTSGMITATGVGTEDNVYYNNAPAANYTGIVVLIDLTSMIGGDQATVREYYRIKVAGNYILKDSVVYSGAQSPDLITLNLEPNRYGIQVTIDATVARTFDYEVFTIE